MLFTRHHPSGFGWFQKKKKKNPLPRNDGTIPTTLWKESVLASKDDPRRDELKNTWAVTTSLEHVPRLLKAVSLKVERSKFWCGYEKKISPMILFYVTTWEKREAPDISESALKDRDG